LVWINDLINHPEYENLLENANKLLETALDKHTEVKDIQMRNIEELYEIMDDAVNTLFDGITKSLNKPTKNTNAIITLDKDTSKYVSKMFYLHSLLYIILGHSMDDYKDKITTKLTETLEKGIMPMI